MRGDTGSSPFVPHTPTETEAMLSAVGVESISQLFDIPEAVRFEGSFDIDARGEQELRQEIGGRLERNDDLTSFLGRGHYDHYVPAIVDSIAGRQEFLTSYTQYQPEIAQGFLQSLFEYQSILVELTGLSVANCSLYDAATALGEAATLASRSGAGDRILVPELLRQERRAVLENYAAGPGLTIEAYPSEDGAVDIDALSSRIDEDVGLVYAESPTVRGTIEESLSEIGAVATEANALFCLGTDPVALALLEEPARVGVDVVVGDAASLGLGHAHGMGLGMFATSEELLRQVPGRLVGATRDQSGRRAYTLTLQTREQHIRRERATSNICTNQAWLALRAAIHAAALGPDGLLDLAETSVHNAKRLADRLDEITGIKAPVHDRHHFREFVARTDQPAQAVSQALLEHGYAIHAIDDHLIQVCVTETNADATDGLVRALREEAA